MKSAIIFPLIYFSCFLALSLIAVAIFDDAKTYEMMSYTVWGCIIYTFVGVIGWSPVKAIMSKTPVIWHGIFSKVVAGMLLINVAVFILSGGHFKWIILLLINIVHLISFTIASIATANKKRIKV